MIPLGYIALSAMGMTLGLVGAGGSILTIPILVYLVGLPIILATSYSLLVVGSTALVAAIRYHRHILFKQATLFLVPSVLGVFGTRHFIMPNLPHSLGTLPTEKALIILLLTFMGIAGYFMVRRSPHYTEKPTMKHQSLKVVLISLTLSIFMGLLGTGGGFLIIPTLVLLMGFTMHEAIPTSLFIITINSFVGFASDQSHLMTADWISLTTYLTPSLLGMFLGLYMRKFIDGASLKKAFGYFVWILGIAILAKEFILT